VITLWSHERSVITARRVGTIVCKSSTSWPRNKSGCFAGHLLFPSFDNYSEEIVHFLGENNEKILQTLKRKIMNFCIEYGHRAQFIQEYLGFEPSLKINFQRTN
jgi:hypothetical protein